MTKLTGKRIVEGVESADTSKLANALVPSGLVTRKVDRNKV